MEVPSKISPIKLTLIALTLGLMACAPKLLQKASSPSGGQESQNSVPQPVTVTSTIPVSKPAEDAPADLISPEDSVSISVYNDSNLNKTQKVRADGCISMLLIGDVKVSGLTVPDARELITRKLTKYFLDPKVDVYVTENRGNKVYVVGKVSSPGSYTFWKGLNLLETMALAGGASDGADLSRAYLLRNGQVVPVDFYRLMIDGDLSQNVNIQAQDIVVIPDNTEQKVFVLGEVTTPQVIKIRNNTTLLEIISDAGGFTTDAAEDSVLLIRGNLAHPQIFKLDAEGILKKGLVAHNMTLKRGDIVYVPASTIANVERFFNRIQSILAPIVTMESGITLSPDVISIIKRGKKTSGGGGGVVVSTPQ